MTPRSKRSAGLLMYRKAASGLQVLLAHPGGPLFTRKDAGVWSIPKGEFDGAETPLTCAKREFEEETGRKPLAEAYVDLGTIQQKGGKLVYAFAFEGDWDVRELRSNTFNMQWPPRSGRSQEFPEIDRMEFFSLEAAREKLNPAQVEFLDRLVANLATG